MILCTFSLPIQSHLALPENTAFFFKVDDRLVAIQCRTLDGAKLFSHTGENYDWLTKEEGVENRHIAAVSETGQRQFVRQVFWKTADKSFSGGVVDLVKFTQLQVSFEIKNIDILGNEKQFTKLKAWVTSILERFVDLYRIVIQEGDVTRFRIQEIPAVDIWIAKEYTFNSTMIDAKQDWHGRILDWSDTSTTNHFKGIIQEKSIHLIGFLLNKGVPIRLFEQLLLDCKEQSMVRGQQELRLSMLVQLSRHFLRSV